MIGGFHINIEPDKKTSFSIIGSVSFDNGNSIHFLGIDSWNSFHIYIDNLGSKLLNVAITKKVSVCAVG